ncbi:uncharacterized protein [Panulirus ornatus]|uniref:uncharacterized protein isoform X2 n=1 Tax=Panulirus ornatus TaxID=150431 RepID=UPI003A86AD50
MTALPLQAVKLQLLCLVLCQALLVFCAEFTHDRKRLGPLESVRAEHGCLEKFEVSENTILRTKISQGLGAKFLIESDVGNREDCLTYCCETHMCNVAVFEEKESGACYLFDCGQPGDFKCTFTTHTFYTSSVLRVNRHQLELGLWSEQSQHEAELANLRSSGEVDDTVSAPGTRHVAPTTPPAPPPKATSPTTTSTTTTTTTTTTSTTAKPTVPSTTCRRFEFKCQSGECIAVYNVCDGIPQCQDNSDEDPAISCPVASTEGAARGRPSDGAGSVEPGQANGAVWDNTGPVRDNNHDPRSSGDAWQGGPRFPNYGQGYDRGIFSHHSNILDNYGHYQPPGGPMEDGQGYGGRGRGPTYYDYNQRPAWPGPRYNGGESGGRGGEYMAPDAHRALHYPDYGQPQQQQQPPQQQQQQQQQLLPPMQQPQMNNNPVWMDKPNYPPPQSQQQLHQQMQELQYGGQGMPQQQQQQQQQAMQQQHQQPVGPYQQRPVMDPVQNMLSNSPVSLKNTEMGMSGGNSRVPTRSEPPVSVAKTLIPSTTAPLATPSTGVTSHSTSNSSAGGSQAAAPAVGVPHAHTPVQSSHTNAADVVAHSSMARLEVNLEELEMEAREQDAQASGAVLALAMGVCITALLVVLVGCRLRSVRRRLRRTRGSRSPYAHDADYLVNGMYL